MVLIKFFVGKEFCLCCVVFCVSFEDVFVMVKK